MKSAAEILSPAKLITLNLGHGFEMLANEATFDGKAVISGRSSLADAKSLSLYGPNYFLIELREGIFVQTGKSALRPIETGEEFLLPQVSRIESVSPSDGYVRLREFAQPFDGSKPKEEGPGWLVSFFSGEKKYEMNVYFDFKNQKWEFEQLSCFDSAAGYDCEFCGCKHRGKDDKTLFCYFLKDSRVESFVGKQLVGSPLFLKRALQTAGKWRFKLSLCRTFRCLPQQEPKKR